MKTNHWILAVLLCAISLGVVATLNGCADSSAAAARGGVSAQCPHAECFVCKHNADLACVDVAVDAKTPSAEYAGQTYYFCSEDCRKQFAKNPQAYLSK